MIIGVSFTVIYALKLSQITKLVSLSKDYLSELCPSNLSGELSWHTAGIAVSEVLDSNHSLDTDLKSWKNTTLMISS